MTVFDTVAQLRELVAAKDRELEHHRKEIARLDAELVKERGGAGTVAKLRIENHRLRARLALLEPVFEAAKAWHLDKYPSSKPWDPETVDAPLVIAIDAALAAEQKERGDG